MSVIEDAPVRRTSTAMPEPCFEWRPNGVDWCDITPYVTGWSWSGGQDHELDRAQAGNGQLVLTEITSKATVPRLFDRENTASPFYPWLKVRKQIRYSVVWSGVRYPVWHAYISEWGDTMESDVRLDTTVSYTDASVILDGIDITESWFELAAGADNPTHWWMLSATTAAPIDSGTSRVAGFYDGGLPTLGAEAIIPFDGGKTSTTWDEAWISLPSYAPNGTSPGFSIEGWFKLDAADLPATSSVYPLCWFGKFDVIDLTVFERVQVNMYGSSSVAPGQMSVSYRTNSGINEAFSGTNLADGNPHHFVATLNATSAVVQLYVDSVLLDSDASVHSDDWFDVTINGVVARGAIGTGYFTTGRNVFPGTQSHLIVYEGQILTATQVAAHYDAGDSAFEGDTTGEAIGRILDYKGWPSTLRDIDTGSSTIGGYDLPNGSLLDYVQELVDTELGELFVDGENRLVFRSRHYRYVNSRATTSQATIGDTHSNASLFFDAAGFELSEDATLIRNPVTASRQGGMSATVEDAELSDPFTGYGSRAWSAPASKDRLDTAMRGRARWLLNLFKEPTTRLKAATLKPSSSTALWPVVLAAKYLDRWTIKHIPANTGVQIVIDQHIEAFSHHGTPTTWEIDVVGAPVDDTDYLIVGSGLVGVGRVGY